MRVEKWIFGAGTFFFLPMAAIYAYVTSALQGRVEAVGVVALVLTAGLSLLVGLYLAVTARRIDPRPEDNPLAEVHEGSGEQGFFSPWSWWPLAIGATCALVFLGVAVGWWLSMFGGALAVFALIGWAFEYYRGEHAH